MPQRDSNSHSNKRAAADRRLRASGRWDRLAVALPSYSSALSCLRLPLEPGNLQSGKIFSFSKINLFFFKTASHFSSSFFFFPLGLLFLFLLLSFFFSSSSPFKIQSSQKGLRERQEVWSQCVAMFGIPGLCSQITAQSNKIGYSNEGSHRLRRQ